MSKFYDTAELIASHLKTVQEIKALPIVVDRQKDIASELRNAIAKQSGCLILVTWTGAANDDQSADGPHFLSRYTVTLFSKPVIRNGETAADDVMEAIATALHDYRPTGNFHDRLVVTGIDPVPDDELLIYRLNLTTPNQI